MPTVAAMILAGGQSRRMGQDKALLTVEGEPLIQRLSHHALACTSAVFVVTPWPDRYRPLLPSDIRFIPEVRSPEAASPGPLVALAAAIDQIVPPATENSPNTCPDWILALACDLPNLTAAVLQGWIADLDAIAPDILAYLPQNQGRWEPLCGFYRPSCVPSWQAYLATGARSFQGWLNQNPVQVIANVDPRWLVNLNTPDDLSQWER